MLLLLSGDVHPDPGPNNPNVPLHSSKSLSFYSINICSLPNKVDHLIAETDLPKTDIIAVQET